MPHQETDAMKRRNNGFVWKAPQQRKLISSPTHNYLHCWLPQSKHTLLSKQIAIICDCLIKPLGQERSLIPTCAFRIYLAHLRKNKLQRKRWHSIYFLPSDTSCLIGPQATRMHLPYIRVVHASDQHSQIAFQRPLFYARCHCL